MSPFDVCLVSVHDLYLPRIIEMVWEYNLCLSTVYQYYKKAAKRLRLFCVGQFFYDNAIGSGRSLQRGQLLWSLLCRGVDFEEFPFYCLTLSKYQISYNSSKEMNDEVLNLL